MGKMKELALDGLKILALGVLVGTGVRAAEWAIPAPEMRVIVCTMDDPLAPAGVTALITVTVRVDNDAAAETLVNRAKVIGAYVPDAFEAGPLPRAMDCLSALKGTVCALSAEVTVTVDDSGQEAPTTTSSGQLPATGSESASMLLLGAWLAGAGVVVMVLRRRGAC